MENLYDAEQTGQDGFDSEKMLLLSRYLAKVATAEETSQVETWLATDPLLFQTYRSMLSEDGQEFTASEQQAAVAEVDLSADDLFENLKKMNGSGIIGEVQRGEAVSITEVAWWQQGKYQLAAAAVLLLGLIGGPRYYSYMNTGMKVAEVVAFQEQEHTIDFNQARLSGDYRGESIPMSPESGVSEAEQKLLDAIAFSDTDDDTEAYRRLAHEYFLLGKSAKLRPVFERLVAVESKSHFLLNDLGSIAYKLHPLNGAARANGWFREAVEAAPGNPLYQYNLAITEIELGNLPEAIRLLEACLEAEADPGWRNRAQRKLDLARSADTPP